MADLLEREGQLAEIDGLLRARSGRTVLVAGEAGIGKTALLRRFCETRSVRALWGTCDAVSAPRPLGPLVEMAEHAGGALADLAGHDANPADVATVLVAELRARGPSVAVIEDVHWADEATLDVLRLVSRRIEPVPALVVATFRDDHVDRTHPLRVALGEIGGSPTVVRIDLAPLSPEAVAELATGHDIDAAELHRRTAGNPFFVTEVLAAGSEELPPTVRDAVLARAARLSAGARRLLDAIAIAPPGAELWLLEALAGADLSGLEECLLSGMVERAGGRFAFRHELAREAIEDSIAPDRALALDRSAAAALAEPPDGSIDHARLAYHAERARDGRLVLRFAPAAGDRAAAAGAHREAAAQYARALRFGHALSTRQRATLLERRAFECYLTAELGEAALARRAAMDCYDSLGDRRRQADQLRWLSRLDWLLGRENAAEASGRAAVAMLERLAPGHELAMAYSNLSQLEMLTWDTEAAVGWGERATDLAERLGDPEVLVHALANVGAAEARAGVEDGRDKLERSLRLALEHGLEEHVARAYLNLGSTAVQHRDLAAADRHLAAGLDYSGAHDLVSPAYHMTAWRARSELDQGRWADAGRLAEDVLRSPGVAPSAGFVALLVRALVRARSGEPDASEALGEARALTVPAALPAVAAATAEAAWLTGEPCAAAAELEEALDIAVRRGDGWAAGELALWSRRLGLGDRAPRCAAEPYALQLAGRWRSAARAWEELGCPYEAALALADGDEAARRSGLDRLHALHAVPAARRVARHLRQRGARGLPRGPRPSTRRNPGLLTAREAEVVALLAEGLPNARIAVRLSVSVKTVEHHVSAILRKLDARNRTEAGAKAARLGLANIGRFPDAPGLPTPQASTA